MITYWEIWKDEEPEHTSYLRVSGDVLIRDHKRLGVRAGTQWADVRAQLKRKGFHGKQVYYDWLYTYEGPDLIVEYNRSKYVEEDPAPDNKPKKKRRNSKNIAKTLTERGHKGLF